MLLQLNDFAFNSNYKFFYKNATYNTHLRKKRIFTQIGRIISYLKTLQV